MNLSGNRFISFEEIFDEDKAEEERKYVLLNPNGVLIDEEFLNSIESFVIGEGYLSFDYVKNEERAKLSFLRRDQLNEKNFSERQWFEQEYLNLFGYHYSFPSTASVSNKKISSDDRYLYYRIRQFNTGEPRGGGKSEFDFYLSENSSEENDLIEMVREAFGRWNQAFQIIKNDLDVDKIIQLNFKEERKPLGDIRYNYVNLLYNEEDYLGILKRRYRGSIYLIEDYFYLSSPSVFSEDTGQMISSTININVNEHLKSFINDVRMYIRYEIFKKDYQPKEDQKIHVVSPYLKKKIRCQCKEVIHFVNNKKKERGLLPDPNQILDDNKCEEVAHFINDPRRKRRLLPNQALNDTELFKPCALKIAKNYLTYFIFNQIGWNLGLSYNYEASADSNNYYKNFDEIKASFDFGSFS